MKKLKNSVIALLCLMMACLMLSGCEKTSSQIEAENQKVIQAAHLEDVEAYTSNLAQALKTLTLDQFLEGMNGGGTLVSSTFDNDLAQRWIQFNETHGAITDAYCDIKERTHTGFTGRIIMTGEDGGMMALTVNYDTGLRPISTLIGEYSDDSKETLGSKMMTAGSNTLTGLLVVFGILVFLTLIISCFKFLNKGGSEVKPQKKDAPKAAPAPAKAAAPAAEEINLAKNQELVAVIMAAIAASEENNTSGYVVRSIKRLHTNKWR